MFKNITPMLLLACFVCVLALGQDSKQPNNRLPLVVLIETNPWLWVLGSDSPIFALYDDGLVIFTKKEGAFYPATYYSAVLSKSGVDSLVSSFYLSSIDSLPDKSVGTQQRSTKQHSILFSRR